MMKKKVVLILILVTLVMPIVFADKEDTDIPRHFSYQQNTNTLANCINEY